MTEEKLAAAACMAGLGFTEDMLLGGLVGSQNVCGAAESLGWVGRGHVDTADSTLRSMMLIVVVHGWLPR